MVAEKKIDAVRLMAACREQVMEIAMCAENDDERLVVAVVLRKIADELFDKCEKTDKDSWNKRQKLEFLYWCVFQDDPYMQDDDEQEADNEEEICQDSPTGLYDEEAEREWEALIASVIAGENAAGQDVAPHWIRVVSSKEGHTSFRCSGCGRIVYHAGGKCPGCWREMDTAISREVEVTV